MGAISRKLTRFCYNHPKFCIPDLMKYIAIGNVVVYLLNMLTGDTASLLLQFHPSLILQGQIWRLITFVFVPRDDFILWVLLSIFFYYWIGTSLERQWGSVRFTVYYGMGILLNVILGMLTGVSVSMYYINMSMFFAFATLYPDMQVLLYGIIPLKVKWLAWFDAFFFGMSIISYLMGGHIFAAMVPIIAIFNYLVFFWDELTGSVKHGRERMVHKQRRAQTIDFKKAQKDVQQKRGYLHKCTICGVTDTDDCNMEFRYCSKCTGYHCYCANHINNHDHIL